MALNISSVTSLPKYSFNEAKSLFDGGFGINEIIPNMNPKYIGNMVAYGLENAKNPDAYWLSLSPELREANYKLYENYKTNQASQMFANAEQKGIISPTTPNKSNDDKWLDLATQAQNDYRGMEIANGVFDGISSLTNMGLGIWNAVEQSQNNAKLRDVYDKQMALAQEQIDASKELREQRQKEIARLKRVRSNTNQRFNSSAIVSRSY